MLHQRDQVVSPAGIPSGGAEAGLEIFLGTLLGMEADAVVGRIFANAPFAFHEREVTLGFRDPFSGQRLHRAAFRAREFPE